MNSVGEECNELKREYDACFNVWYTDYFLKGDRQTTPCKEMFEKYRTCVMKAIKEKNISIDEINDNTLGTGKEKQSPPDQ
ncbi:predicted protein [Nematostella vectensis]|uniref:TP53-regulated inhibitor of apoptosis 1 n=1 Tax=Nematostella vectensis TaxID=45351 RepID=A7SVU1_NEMVE|nr:predicted protein [Nematostella vectensis]|eukprot:XP_001624260.1 predicted protein [Nematostella vectensis]